MCKTTLLYFNRLSLQLRIPVKENTQIFAWSPLETFSDVTAFSPPHFVGQL